MDKLPEDTIDQEILGEDIIKFVNNHPEIFEE